MEQQSCIEIDPERLPAVCVWKKYLDKGLKRLDSFQVRWTHVSIIEKRPSYPSMWTIVS